MKRIPSFWLSCNMMHYVIRLMPTESSILGSLFLKPNGLGLFLSRWLVWYVDRLELCNVTLANFYMCQTVRMLLPMFPSEHGGLILVVIGLMVGLAILKIAIRRVLLTYCMARVTRVLRKVRVMSKHVYKVND